MLAKPSTERDLNNKNFIGEVKIDGTRCMLIKKDGGFKLINRNFISYTNKFPEFLQDIENLPDCILDGELAGQEFRIVESRCSTESRARIEILSKRYPLKFMFFDILELDGEDLRDMKLIERKKILSEVLNEGYENFVEVEWTEDLWGLWGYVKRNDLEGIMLKRKDGRYVAGRSCDWLKVKNFKEEILKFDGYEENPAGVVLINPAGVRVQCAGNQSSMVKDLIDKRGFVFAEIQYLEKTDNGKLRMPTFRRVVLDEKWQASKV